MHQNMSAAQAKDSLLKAWLMSLIMRILGIGTHCAATILSGRGYDSEDSHECCHVSVQ